MIWRLWNNPNTFLSDVIVAVLLATRLDALNASSLVANTDITFAFGADAGLPLLV